MAHLRLYDYISKIQTPLLNQFISNNNAVRLLCEVEAEEEAVEYLSEKYDITNLPNTVAYNYEDTYFAGQLVELNFPTYSATSTYALYSLVINSGNAYINIMAITISEAFTIGKWKLLGAQYDLFYIPYPFPVFDVYSIYKKGDLVFWRNKIYKCLIETTILDHDSRLQYADISSVPIQNVFPDNLIYGQKHWGVGIDYSFSELPPTATSADFPVWNSATAYVMGNVVGFDGNIWQASGASTNVEPGTDFTAWIKILWAAGDNRAKRLVQKLLYISIYNMMPRISPNNIPAIYKDQYQEAIMWLKTAAQSEIQLPLLKIQPKQGNRIRHGGNIPDVTSY